MSDILKRPVHPILHKKTLVEEENLFTGDSFTTARYTRQPFPKEEVKKKRKLIPKSSRSKKTKKKVKLNVLHSRVPPIREEDVPDCDNCNTKACCSAFLVSITKEEYESGIYEHAVKFTKEQVKQIASSPILMQNSMDAVNILAAANFGDQYYLDGNVGEPCPYLGEKGMCTIYHYRPITCRTYTCKLDSRMTDEMRDGV